LAETIIFTLRSDFTLPGLGEVDDSDVIEYTPTGEACGEFAFRLVGADVGLTDGEEDIDGLGITEDGSLLVSTIGTAEVPGSNGEELVARDQSVLKEEANGTWSLYFDGEDVELIDSSEDIRSIWLDIIGDAQGNKNLYLTLSGDFAVASDNEDEGDKNDVEGCTPLALGETTTCFFFKLLDGADVDAENQLDGLAVEFGGTIPPPVTALSPSTAEEIAREVQVEAITDNADFAEALAQGDSEISPDDLIDIVATLYLPLIEQ
jgi:hypothetical protein